MRRRPTARGLPRRRVRKAARKRKPAPPRYLDAMDDDDPNCDCSIPALHWLCGLD